ncbi:MAG TPA: 4a-hydroxytetrahydrobiopterin dehydratase [Rudaea sp.]|nr:4a-hydroxytetrahydrobiopterin dehydratase [Rudaea sp.]
MNIETLRTHHCRPLKGPQHRLDHSRSSELLALLGGWEFGPEQSDIRKRFKFDNFMQALAFVNAAGWIAEQENHHPDLELGWGRCLVRFSTHDVGGLSMNDFICAAKVHALFEH